VQLAEIGRFDDTVTDDDFLADFTAEFHDLRRARAFAKASAPKRGFRHLQVLRSSVS
jgi:hypothetical protein